MSERGGIVRPAFDSCWDDVVNFLVHENVEHVFGLPGDDLEAVAAFERGSIRPRWVRDQRVAVGAAAGASLGSGRPAVCIVGRGPGAAAAVPWVLEAWEAGVPVLVISGGVPFGMEGRGVFQDAPLVDMFRPVTKRAVRIVNPDSTIPELTRSLSVAVTGAPGPVFVELSDGLQKGQRSPGGWMTITTDPRDSRVWDLISESRRLALVVGGGCSLVEGRLAQKLAEKWDIPLFCSASGRGMVDESHPLYLGLAGLYSRGDAEMVLSEAHAVVAVGTRLEETVTEGWPSNRPVIQVTTEPMHLAVHRPGVGVLNTARQALDSWLSDPELAPAGEGIVRRRYIEAARAEGSIWAEKEVAQGEWAADGARIPALMSILAERLPEFSVVVHENGLADIWSYHFPVFRLPPNTIDICPSEQTTLGFGTAAAVGASRANPDRFVVSIGGDGALAAVAADRRALGDTRARVLWIVLDNGGHGWLQAAYGTSEEGIFATAAERGCSRFTDVVSVRELRVSEPLADAVADAVAYVRRRSSMILIVPVSLEDRPPAAGK